MGKLESIEDHQLAYTALTAEDFASLDINPKELPAILEDLHTHFGHFATIALFFWYQNGNGNGNGTHIEPHVRGLVSSREEHVLERIMQQFPAKRRGRLTIFKVPVDAPEDAPKMFLEKSFGFVLEPAEKEAAVSQELQPIQMQSGEDAASDAENGDINTNNVEEDELDIPYASLRR